MSSIDKYSNFFIVVFFIFFLNLSGCATHSVWEKRANNTANILNEEIAGASNIYVNCNDNKWSNYQAIIPYKTKRNTANFPPFSEGYIAIGSDEKLSYIIKKMNESQLQKNTKETMVFIDAELWRISGTLQSKMYYSGYHYGIKNNYGNIQKFATRNIGPANKNSKEIKLNFNVIDNSYSIDSNCELLNLNPIKISIIFKDGSLKYEPYKYPIALRVVLTPFSVVLDAVTSPLQLIAFVTVPLWAPR
jgi:uncharacterized protein YceK